MLPDLDFGAARLCHHRQHPRGLGAYVGGYHPDLFRNLRMPEKALDTQGAPPGIGSVHMGHIAPADTDAGSLVYMPLKCEYVALSPRTIAEFVAHQDSIQKYLADTL